MVLRSNGRTVLAGAMLICIVPAVSGCVGHGGGRPEPTLAGFGSPKTWEDPSAFPGGGAADRIPATSGGAIAARTEQGDLAQAQRPRQNRQAADLLDHWGHRRVQSVVEGLSLSTATPNADGADPKRLRAAAQARDGTSLAPKLHADDEVRPLGSRHGVAYGRWTGGPADTLAIKFDLSRAGPAMRHDPAFRAMLERSGKAWSRRIADTWASWDRAPGDFKGWLWNDGTRETRVLVGPAGETSDRLEIDVKDNELAGAAGRGGSSGRQAPVRSREPRFGEVQIDREFLNDAGEASLFHVLAHEIGHALGAWDGREWMQRYALYTDTERGTWTGPNVVALHGRAAPFQDEADPFTWVNGERSPQATEIDFAHSGVCSSVMAYCSRNDPRPAFLPHAIDFAFLADLGMTVTDETDRPETYGLAGWTDYAGFALSVSRDLQIAIGQSGHNGYRLHSSMLDVTDLLQVEVDVFGLRSAGDLSQSHAAEGLSGTTVRYAGGLLGAAINLTGLPPVTGDTSLAVNLGSLDGTASFTSLQVHTHGTSWTFSGGSLHYPFELSANGILGTGTGSTLLADFYGPAHENVAGALHDPGAGLLASFGATYDERPGREDVVASADRLLGGLHRTGAADPAADGWTRYRCTAASACESRQAESDGWGDWTAATRSETLAATAGWTWRHAGKPETDRGLVRIARYSESSTDGLQGRHVVDGYTGTLEHVSFGTGFERHTDWSLLLGEGIAETDSSLDKWAGVQGTASGAPPDEVASWSGPMLGYQGGRAANETPFVEGVASIRFSLLDNSVDVAFSRVASRDGRRRLLNFAFRDLPMQDDGTFARDDTAGALDGAFFGPSQEEAGGAFHHNASDVTGSFGARRLPDIAALEESGPSETQPPIVEEDESRYVGADAAPELDELTATGDYGGVAVSSGRVQDGAGADRVLAYLERHIDEDYNNWVSGLATFPDPPVVRVAWGASEELVAYTETAVRLINSALPRDNRIVFSRVRAPRSTAIENVPEGEVFVDFTRKQDWNLREGRSYRADWLYFRELDPIQEYNDSAQRHENKGMRAAHLWFDRRLISNAAWVWDPDTETWNRQVLNAPVIESDTVNKVYTEERVIRQIVRVLLKAIGFFGSIDQSDFPDSILAQPRQRLPNIDSEVLLAAYTRLAPGTQPEDLSAESLGPWEDTSFHLRGGLELAGGEAAFGVALRNGLARPWASGPAPLAALENNSALYGTVSWNGALLGLTPSAETVAGQARLAVELSTLDAQLDFTGLERWGVKVAPGEVGSGTIWGDGDLGYAVGIQGNSFYRIGGDDGEVAGAFLGAAHEAMGGVLERSDLTAGFGGTR